MNLQAKITHIDGVNIQNGRGIFIVGMANKRLNGLYNINFKRYTAQGKRNRFHRNKFVTVIKRKE